MGTSNLSVILCVLWFTCCITPSNSQVIPKTNSNQMFERFYINLNKCHIKYFFEGTVNYADVILSEHYSSKKAKNFNEQLKTF